MTDNKIAFQGHYGAFSDMACRAACPGFETLPCKSFDDAFIAVQEGRAARAMIPIDNTIAGRVADVHHLMPDSGLFIIGEHFQPVSHNLLVVKGAALENLEHVHTHVHALPQCRNIIRELRLKAHVDSDTAGSARHVAEAGDKAHAAIASSLAAEIYDLEILREDIQDAEANTTRFLILTTEPDVPDFEGDNGAYITTLTFSVRNIPAALYKSLGGFATNGLSLAKLESYVDQNFQAAQFYCDVQGHSESEAFKLALEELGFYADDVTFFGTYKAHEFRNAV